MQTANVFGEIVPLNEHLKLLNKIWVGPADPNFDMSKDQPPQAIFHRHEIPIADYLMSFQDALREEFLTIWGSLENFHNKGTFSKTNDGPQAIKTFGGKKIDTSWSEAIRTKSKTLNLSEDENETVSNPSGWRVELFKYTHADKNIKLDMNAQIRERHYPTSDKILKEFGDDCPIANYSYLAPQTQIHRHTGIENRTGEFIRIHIPLIIPKGDVFFECNDVEVTWNDIFAFDNQLVHSAHNLTDEGRLVFLLDIRRSRIGMQPGEPWNIKREKASPTIYIRKPKV